MDRGGGRRSVERKWEERKEKGEVGSSGCGDGMSLGIIWGLMV